MYKLYNVYKYILIYIVVLILISSKLFGNIDGTPYVSFSFEFWQNTSFLSLLLPWLYITSVNMSLKHMKQNTIFILWITCNTVTFK